MRCGGRCRPRLRVLRPLVAALGEVLVVHVLAVLATSCDLRPVVRVQGFGFRGQGLGFGLSGLAFGPMGPEPSYENLNPKTLY